MEKAYLVRFALEADEFSLGNTAFYFLLGAAIRKDYKLYNGDFFFFVKDLKDFTERFFCFVFSRFESLQHVFVVFFFLWFLDLCFVSFLFLRRGFGLVMAITYVYYAGYIEADEMSFGDGGLKMEGLMPSLATFILAWTTVFTAMGHDLPGIA